MKNGLFLHLPLLFLVIAVSCGNSRRPGLSDKELFAQRKVETLQETEEQAPDFSDMENYIVPSGIKYKESRAVDPASPPITLKVAVPQGAMQPLKLSRFGKSVEYVTLKLPDEKDFFLSQTDVSYDRDWFQIPNDNWLHSLNIQPNTQVILAGDYFVTSDVLGIRLFDNKGAFVKNLLMSEFEGTRNVHKVETIREGCRQAILRDWQDNRFFLAMREHSSDKAIYISQRKYSQKVFVGEYRITSQIVDDPVMTQVHNYPPGLFLDHQTLFNFRSDREIRQDNQLAISFNQMGDTLCTFANHVRFDVVRLTNTAISDRSFSCRSDGKLFFRQGYCDTIFRVHSANRIVPAYRFDFGALRVSVEEGLTGKTQGKLLPWKWIALKNSMILIFTEGRDAPIYRTSGEVSFHCLMFDRQTGRSTAIDMKSKYPEDVLIENDIDSGLPVPLNTIDVQDNAMIATFTKGQIEEILKNNAKNMSAETVSKLKETANALKSNEMLVMIISNL